LPFEHAANVQGYREAAELRDKARLIAVQIAMTIAMWDGSLGDREGEALRQWIKKVLSGRSIESQDALKSDFNRAMKTAYQRIKDGDLSLSELTDRLNDIGDDAIKYEATELCFDVLASSAFQSSDKARVIDLVAKSLRLDAKEVERIRDIKIVGFLTELSRQVRIEDLLGISSQWSANEIKRHLRAEFQKWNNRINTLPEGDERENAQRMLDAISEARSKYG
jgi:hypothetical protein